MEFLESFGSVALLFVLPAVTGALSGFAGIYLLFRFVESIAKWRGQRVAIVGTALLCGLSFAIPLFSPIFFMEGIAAGLIGILTGGVFASGIFRHSRTKTIFSSSVLGFFLAFLISALIVAFITRPIFGKEDYIGGTLNILLAIISGIGGLIAGGISGAIRKSE